jgi:hypothetical protein
MLIKCINCNKTLEFENFKNLSIGEIEKDTNWLYSEDIYSREEMWLCENCKIKAVNKMKELLEIVKFPFYKFTSLIPFKERVEYIRLNKGESNEL